MRKFTRSLLALSALSLVVAAGCSSDDSSSETEDTGMVGGMTTCDDTTVLAAANDSAPEGVTYEGVDGLECADGWAVLFTTEVSADDPENGVGTTLIFEAEGQFWIPKSPMDVCGTYDDSDPNARPDDALVPEALFEAGCRTN